MASSLDYSRTTDQQPGLTYDIRSREVATITALGDKFTALTTAQLLSETLVEINTHVRTSERLYLVGIIEKLLEVAVRLDARLTVEEGV